MATKSIEEFLKIRTEEKSLVEFTSEYLKVSKKNDTHIKRVNLAMSNFMSFISDEGISDSIHSLDISVKEDFIFYLKDRGLMITTIKGIISCVSTLIRKAQVFGYHIDASWFESSISDEETNGVALSRDELIKLYYFENLSKAQKRTRDLFIIGCFTGLRFSDYSRLTESNCLNGRIKIRTKKTKQVVEIPQNKYVKEILSRYGGKAPNSQTIQQFNRMMKVICKKVGFNDLIMTERTVGHSVVEKTYEKWQLISSHTARRSAATNMYLSGIRVPEIMMITGHRSEKSLMRYIKITQEETLRSLESNQFFR